MPGWLEALADLVRRHLGEIAITLTAMILVVAGPYINKGAKALTRPMHWLARYGLFVALATAGYGALTTAGVWAVRRLLTGLPDGPLLATVAGAHLAMAWVLKRERHI